METYLIIFGVLIVVAIGFTYLGRILEMGIFTLEHPGKPVSDTPKKKEVKVILEPVGRKFKKLT